MCAAAHYNSRQRTVPQIATPKQIIWLKRTDSANMGNKSVFSCFCAHKLPSVAVVQPSFFIGEYLFLRRGDRRRTPLSMRTGYMILPVRLFLLLWRVRSVARGRTVSFKCLRKGVNERAATQASNHDVLSSNVLLLSLR